MEVERDFDNEYDEFAMKVSMPDVTKVKAGLLDAITRPVYLILKNGTAYAGSCVWRFSLTAVSVCNVKISFIPSCYKAYCSLNLGSNRWISMFTF